MGGRCNIVQLGKRVSGKIQRSAGNVFAEVRDGRSAGNQQNIRGAPDSHASATPIGVASSLFATDFSVSNCNGVKPPSGK